MHRLLQRQLKRAFGLADEAGLETFVGELHDAAADPRLPEAVRRLCLGFRPLLERIDSAYAQHERDLSLRNRSLNLSSEELTRANQRLREEAERQARIVETLRGAANKLLTVEGIEPIGSDHASLEKLSGLMAALMLEKQAARRELEQQKFALDQHAIVSITDPRGIITYANDKFCDISGYTREELIGTNHRIVNSGYHDRGLFEGMWRTIAAGKVWHGEVKNRDKQGGYYWVAATIVPIPGEDGRPQQYVAIRTDISQQKALEEEISESRQFLQSVTDSMGEGIYALDTEGHCTFLNPEAERLLGWSRSDLGRRNFHDTIHFQRDDGTPVPAADCPAGRAVARGETFRSEEESFTRRDGEIFPISIVAVPLRRDGEIIGQVGVFQDITERRLIQETLRESQEQLQIALDASQTGLWDWNPQSDQAYFSEQWLGMLGYRYEEVEQSGRGWLALLHPDDLPGVQEALEAHLSSASPTYEVEFRMRHRNGEWRWILAAGQVTGRDERGRVNRVTGIHKDIHERKRMEAQLHEAIRQAEMANRSKSEFLANMSHEIRTPMNAVIGLSHLALQAGLDERQRGYLTKIQSSAKNLLGIINDILDFSKIEAGRMQVERTEFSLQDVLDQVVAVTALRAEEKGLELMVSRPADLPQRYQGDPLRLGQVLTNLMGNAVKFTEEGEVTLAVSPREVGDGRARLHFSVSDTGIGLTGEQLGKLFRSFSQADASTTRKYGGTGLGLAISQHLVELMGGEIRVESEPGVGSRFHFELPLDLAEQREPPLSEAAIDLRGLRVLVADDRPTAREILCTMLDSLGMRPTPVPSGTAALAALREANGAAGDDPYRLLLIDWKMPELDGLATLERLAADEAVAQQPQAILVTAYGREEVRRHPAAAEVPLLTKPVTPSALLDTILIRFGHAGIGHHRDAHAAARDGEAIQGILGAHVLLVEDNAINRQVAGELLEELGLRVSMATNGREGVAAVARESFELVLMDVQMPEMDGFEATRTIRATGRHPGLPIIALTAHAMEGDRERCLAAGMDDHLTKPIDPDRLFEMLVKWIRPGQREVAIPHAGVQPAEQLPPLDLEGLDVALGLTRLRGNRRLYREILERFTADYGGPEPLAPLAGEGEAALRFAHTLKGVAATLGAQPLAERAGAIEQGLREGRKPDGAELERLGAILSGLVNGLEAALASGPGGDEAPAAELDHERIAALIGQLEPLLAAGDLEALELTEALLEGVRGNPLAEPARSLKKQVGDFEFERAATTLEEMRSILGGAGEGGTA